MDKPIICSILGVEVGEEFKISGYSDTTVFCILQDGTFQTRPPKQKNSSYALMAALNHPDLVIYTNGAAQQHNSAVPMEKHSEEEILKLLRE